MRWLVPSKRQWNSWSAPSKLTFAGTLLGFLGLVFAVVTYFLPEDAFAKVDENVALYRAKKIQFETYESNVRGIIESKAMALEYLAATKSGELAFVARFRDGQGVEEYSDKVIDKTDLRDLQNAVIAYGFSEQQEPEILLLLDQYYTSQDEFADFLVRYQAGTREQKERLIRTMIVSLNISRAQKETYLGALEKLEEPALDQLYSNLTHFIQGILLRELAVGWDVLRHDINLRRISNTDEKHAYILRLGRSENASGKEMAAAKILAERYGLAMSVQDLRGFECSIPEKAQCDGDQVRLARDATRENSERFESVQCLINDGLPLPEFSGLFGCVVEAMGEDYACVSQNRAQMIEFVDAYIGATPSMDDEERQYWRQLLQAPVGAENHMSDAQVGRLVGILVREAAKLGLLRKAAALSEERSLACSEEKLAQQE